MKEQIIIDGVDVSKCKSYRDEDGYSCEDEEFITGCCDNVAVLDSYGELMYYRPCVGNNCDFKRLARKTQECELAEQLIAGILKTLNLEAYDWRADQNEILTEIKAFKHKCKELKKQIKQLKDTINEEKEAGYSIIERLL